MTQLYGVVSLGGTVVSGSLEKRGLKGEDGNSIESVTMDENYDLEITYSKLPSATIDTGLDTYATVLDGIKDDAVSAKNDAVSAKNDAVSAKNDAVSAKGDAQTASSNASSSASSASSNALKSEGYALGKQNGTDVGSGSDYYHNNSKYFADQASSSATNAGTSESNASSSASSASSSASSASTNALKAEGYAVGKQNGTDVSSGTYYQNNAKYYSGQASSSATSASGSATNANTDALKAEGYAVGKQNGTDVSSGSTYYHNNAKYYADEASSTLSNVVPNTREVNGKALSADITLDAGDIGYDKTETYSSATVGKELQTLMGKIEDTLPTDTASGAIASFPDGSDLFSAKSLVAEINPIQDLHGYDSPWVGGGGTNKLSESWAVGGLSTSNGDYTAQTNTLYTTDFSKVTAGETYYLKLPAGKSVYLFYYTTNNVSGYSGNSGGYQTTGTFTIPSGVNYIRAQLANTYGTTYNYDVALNYPSSVTTYTPYANICPISGWDSVGVVEFGKNIFPLSININDSNYSHQYTALTNPTEFAQIIDIMKHAQASKITYSATVTGTASGVAVGQVRFLVGSTNKFNINPSATQTVPTIDWDSIDGIIVYGSTSGATVKNCQFEIGETATNYEAYQTPTTYTSTLPTTTYGGSVDIVKGVNGGSDERYNYTIDNTVSLSSFSARTNTVRAIISNANLPILMKPNATSNITIMCDSLTPYAPDYVYSNDVEGISENKNATSAGLWLSVNKSRLSSYDIDGLKAWLGNNPLQVVYIRKESVPFSVTPTDVQILKATNNIFADSGNVSVTYKADVQLWVEKKLSE